jgi:hypothetical protein
MKQGMGDWKMLLAKARTASLDEQQINIHFAGRFASTFLTSHI